jgi:two-component system response regulator HydG
MVEKVRTLRVLVVDDEFLIRWSIAEALEHAGHAVVQAEDAASAIRALNEPSEPIDAVVLDYRLPDSDDLGLLANVRRLAPDAPVIMMTAYGSPEVVAGALRLGAYAVLSKPFDVQELERTLTSACRSTST